MNVLILLAKHNRKTEYCRRASFEQHKDDLSFYSHSIMYSISPFSCTIHPVVYFSAVTMTAAALIGDQLILEEDYDDNYTPSEQGTQW